MFARAQRKQTQDSTVATALIVGASDSEMLLLSFFFLLSSLNQMNVAVTGVLNAFSWEVFVVPETV